MMRQTPKGLSPVAYVCSGSGGKRGQSGDLYSTLNTDQILTL